MKKRILLVEDHADTRVVLARLLLLAGYSVTSAGTLREATLAAAHEEFDVLLTDIGLPDGEVTAILNDLRTRGPVRCIALTGHGPESVNQTIMRQFDAFLLKPASIEEIRTAIENAGARKT